MTSPDREALDRLSRHVESAIGVRAAPERREWMVAAAKRLGEDLRDVVAALDDPLRRPALLDRVIDEVTVQESYLFRQVAQLEAIDWTRLLASARADGRDEVAVWCAGCAGGEEAWTLAMLATGHLGARAPVSVLGTDVSGAAVERAWAGRYDERAVRSVPESVLQRCCSDDGDAVVIGPGLRRLVRFGRHNLIGEPAPGRFDLVVCRNVLIYFEQRALRRASAVLAGAVAGNGELLLGAADRLCVSMPAGPPSQRERPRSAHAERPRRRRAAQRRTEGRDRRVAIARETAGAAGPDLADALRMADHDDLAGALTAAHAAVARDPLAARPHLIHGMLHLAAGDAGTAVASLRKALYVDPTIAVAAFQLGRAHDQLGDGVAAVRAYRQALAAIGRHDHRSNQLLGALDVADVAAACRHRLAR